MPFFPFFPILSRRGLDFQHQSLFTFVPLCENPFRARHFDSLFSLLLFLCGMTFADLFAFSNFYNLTDRTSSPFLSLLFGFPPRTLLLLLFLLYPMGIAARFPRLPLFYNSPRLKRRPSPTLVFFFATVGPQFPAPSFSIIVKRQVYFPPPKQLQIFSPPSSLKGIIVCRGLMSFLASVAFFALSTRHG